MGVSPKRQSADGGLAEPLAVTVVEAGRLVGIGRTMAYRLARNGTWPTIRIGRAVRVPMGPLLDWLDRETENGLLA